MAERKEKIRNSIFVQMIIFIVLMIGIFVIYFLMLNRIELNKILYKDLKIDYDVITEIDEFKTTEKEMILSGTAFRLASKTTNVEIVLNTSTGTGNLLLDTEEFSNTKIEQIYDADWDYGVTDFTASIPSKKLKKDVCYEICVNVSYETKDSKENIVAVSTWCYLYNGELYQYNPVDFEKPEFADAYMQDVVDKGTLILFRADKGLYVYQYQDKLHWITNEDFEFLTDTETLIVYHLVTCEENEEMGTVMARVVQGDFYFTNNQYSLEDNSRYQVAIAGMVLKEDAPIIHLRTGVYDTKRSVFKWYTYFNPAMGEE